MHDVATQTRAPGRLSQTLIRLLMKRATVLASEALSDDCRLITLQGEALKGVAWTPGQKIQIAMGSAFVARTYTPIAWNAAEGRTCILAFAHGDGPGSAWVRAAKHGTVCDIFGPRASIDLTGRREPLAVFGDETSIGLGYALRQQDPIRRVEMAFEIADADNGGRVASELGIEDAMHFPRREDDAHLEAMEAALPAVAARGSVFVLTGKAGTIQRLRQSLTRLAVPKARIVTKAYWAPGKTGLD